MESPGGDDPRPSSLTFIPSSRVALRPPPAVVFLLHPTGLEDTESSGPSKLVLTAVTHFGHFPLPAHWPSGPSLTIFCCSRGVPRKIRGTHTLTRGHIHTRARTHTGHNALLWLLLLATVARRKIFRDGSNEKRKNAKQILLMHSGNVRITPAGGHFNESG